MAYATTPVSAYPPPPPANSSMRTGKPSGPDTLATAMAGMEISSRPIPDAAQHYSNALSYHPTVPRTSRQAASAPGIERHQPDVSHSQSPTSANQLSSPPTTGPVQYSPAEYQVSSSLYNPSQPPAFPPPPSYARPSTAINRYTATSLNTTQPGVPQSYQEQHSTHLQPHLQVHHPVHNENTQTHAPQVHHTRPDQLMLGQANQQPLPQHLRQMSTRAPIYAGPPQTSPAGQLQARPQQPEQKSRGLFSSTGKLGAGLVGAVLPVQGKEKLEKWGKGKMNSFAGAMGYTPTTPSSVGGKPSGASTLRPPSTPGMHGPRPVSYAGPPIPGPRPTTQAYSGAERGAGGQPHVANAILAGAAAGGIGSFIGTSLAHDSHNYHPASGTTATADSGALYEQTSVIDASSVNAYSVDASAESTSTIGLGSAITYDQTTVVDASYSNAANCPEESYGTDYSGYQGATQGSLYIEAIGTSNNSSAVFTDTTTVYSGDSGIVYADSTTTYADNSTYGGTDVYSEAAYTETGYATGSDYSEYAETETVVDTGGVGEAVGSGGGGGSWLDSLGLGSSSWTDMSSWGGSADSGAACLGLI